MTQAAAAQFKYMGKYPFGENEPDEMHAQVRGTDGVVRNVNLVNVFPNDDRIGRAFGVSATPGAHEYRLMVQTPNLSQVEALLVVAEFRGEDGKPARQSPRILDEWPVAEHFDGSVIFQHGALTIFAFVLERAITDRALAEAAQRRAEALATKWVVEHDFAPREYRPKRFSDGYVVIPTAFDAWRPLPFSEIDGQKNVTALRSRGYAYNPKDLARAGDATKED